MTLSNYDGFTFDGKSTNSNEFGLTICALDKFDTSTGLEREVVGTELNANRNVKEAFSTKYSNPLTFSIQLAKKDGSFITEQEKNKIISERERSFLCIILRQKKRKNSSFMRRSWRRCPMRKKISATWN